MGQSDDSKIEVDDALAALERFVVENDDLLQLEEHIGRFNIFDALKIVDREVKHSDFLAWLLDPNESHGQGGLFLRAVLMDLFKSARENGFPCPVSPIELDGEELRGVEVRREWRNIDLLIRCEQPRFVVAIENKIRSGEHSNQLNRYRDVIAAEFGGIPCMYAFLTVEGDEPPEDAWVPYSYGDLHRVLTRVRNANETSIGDDVIAFLDHYLRLIKGRLMDDPRIAELCQRIHKNHRQALDLIYEHAGSPTAGLVGRIGRVVVQHPGRWHVANTTKATVFFLPQEWLDILPSIGTYSSALDPHCWMVLSFAIQEKKVYYRGAVLQTSEPDLRERVIRRLTEDPAEFGFRLRRKTISADSTQIASDLIGKSPEEGEQEEALLKTIGDKLDEIASQVAAVPDASRTIIPVDHG